MKSMRQFLKIAFVIFIPTCHCIFYNARQAEYSIANRTADVLRTLKNFARTLTDQDLDITAENSVKIWCTRSDRPQMVDISLNDPGIAQKLNNQLPIAFITHGLNDHGKRQWIQDMANDYARYIQSNVCAVNWSPLSVNFYTVAARSANQVAEVMAKFIKNLVPMGFPLERVTLVGHSMGAHISGMIGHRLKGRIGKIIGLDPAGPYFTTLVPRPKKRRLDRSSAQFVQAIHTDKNIIGTEMNLGHQDFYPSGGATPQPGCLVPVLQPGAMGTTQIVCSHFKAVEYFFYSLNPANRFVGVQCPNYWAFTKGKCGSNRKAQIGLYDSFTKTGVFYLEVSPLPPFALGE